MSQGDMTPVLIAKSSSKVLAFRRRLSIELVYPWSAMTEEENGEEYIDETENPAPVQQSRLCQRCKRRTEISSLVGYTKLARSRWPRDGYTGLVYYDRNAAP
ncbi:hypothetical protein FIBSPDRAFT_896774 [Athelia psychrophila]|uniref:Uncharacterized protein n=1 Tax=Athelia psychrophila TaxID=1759441 RepID=A0A166CYX9_9AGAM|nr:hypothetical protein FIBSPDRAFT_896774 [Fibularhizoctonia sp. CBS 109695]